MIELQTYFKNSKIKIKKNLSLLFGFFGACAGVSSFIRSLLMSAPYNGRDCDRCDAGVYIQMASETSLLDLFTKIQNFRRGGYPAFLRIHKLFLEMVGLADGFNWVTMASISTLGLYFGACIYAFRVARSLEIGVPSASVFFLLAHPGLTSSAALPLSDTLAATALLFGLTVITQVYLEMTRRPYVRSIFVGLCFSFSIYMRPSLDPAIVAILMAWAMLMYQKNRILKDVRIKNFQNPLIVISPVVIAAVIVLSFLVPRYLACSNMFGESCLDNPIYMKNLLPWDIRRGLTSARIYTGFDQMENGRITSYEVVVPDRLFAERLSVHCDIAQERPLQALGLCLLRNIDVFPVFMIKKMIGLFDSFQLNVYSTRVTHWFEFSWNRFFGALGFLGCMVSFYMLLVSCFRKNLMKSDVLAYLFVSLYVCYSSIVHVEARYGFSVVPVVMLIGITSIFSLLRERSKASQWRWVLILIVIVIYYVQVKDWDLMPQIKQY